MGLVVGIEFCEVLDHDLGGFLGRANFMEFRFVLSSDDLREREVVFDVLGGCVLLLTNFFIHC